MRYEIAKQFSFSAAHQLTKVAADHPCARMHGHNYVVTVWLGANVLTPEGFVVDYRDLDYIKGWLDSTFDHRTVNDVVEVEPTAENLAYLILVFCQQRYSQVFKVEVKETDKTTAIASRMP